VEGHRARWRGLPFIGEQSEGEQSECQLGPSLLGMGLVTMVDSTIRPGRMYKRQIRLAACVSVITSAARNGGIGRSTSTK
jgi:hypothetical protein